MTTKKQRVENRVNEIISSPGPAVIEISEIGSTQHMVAEDDDSVFELWLRSGMDAEELAAVEDIWTIEEIGVYGDPELAGTPEGSHLEGKFHVILSHSE
jgi:hypothetical protein